MKGYKPFDESMEIVEAVFTNNKMGFHGDVMITRLDAGEGRQFGKKVANGVLAEGEHTGHCHQLVEGEFELTECEEAPQYKHLRLITPGLLRHQEHNPVRLPAGNYLISIQKEYDHFGERVREVAD